MQQRSPEWYDIRLGKVTASNLAAVIGRTKAGKPTADRERYAIQLISERLTDRRDVAFTSRAMNDGREREPDARAAYRFIRQVEVTEVAFVPHPSIPMAGASPDGLVGTAGLVEFKCPEPKAHIETLESGEVPAEHLPQIMWQMACTERQWCDFVSFHPDMPTSMRIFIKRVERDDARIFEIEREVSAFLREVSDRVNKLRARYDPPAALTPEQVSLLEQSTLLAG